MSQGNTLALFGGEPTIRESPVYEWPIITEEDVKYVMEVLRRREISYNYKDEEVHKLEQFFKTYLDMPYCLALNSGTSGLYLAFIALGLREGDEAIVPTYTFPATVMPLLHLGVKPIFVDTMPNSPNTSIEYIVQKLTTKTRVIVVSHMDGYPVNGEEIAKVVKEHGCYLVEDCAQALGATINGRKIGTFGDISIFSIQQKKLVAGGEGGILATRDREIYEKCILLSYLQKRSHDEVTFPELQPYANTGLGFNFRMYPLAAALANTQFRKMERYLHQRSETFSELSKALKSVKGVRLPYAGKGEITSSYYSFKLLYCPEELELLPIDLYVKALNAEGMPIVKSISKPLHLEQIFQQSSRSFLQKFLKHDNFAVINENSSFPNSEDYYYRSLRMPPFHSLSKQNIENIVAAFEKVNQNVHKLVKNRDSWG